MTSIIVDTSVAVKWFSDENEDDISQARELKQRIAEGEFSLICLEITVLELINVLLYSKKLPHDECERSIQALINLSGDIVSLPDSHSIIDLVYQHKLASYDAAFVSLAMQKNIPLVTADYRHHKKSISPYIVWLSEWK